AARPRVAADFRDAPPPRIAEYRNPGLWDGTLSGLWQTLGLLDPGLRSTATLGCGTEPFQGCGRLSGCSTQGSGVPQPWAVGRNPFRVVADPRAARPRVAEYRNPGLWDGTPSGLWQTLGLLDPGSGVPQPWAVGRNPFRVVADSRAARPRVAEYRNPGLWDGTLSGLWRTTPTSLNHPQSSK